VINGAALLATILWFRDEFSTGRTTTASYQVGIAVLTALMLASIVWQERRRPTT
jgi:hypothetical protein